MLWDIFVPLFFRHFFTRCLHTFMPWDILVPLKLFIYLFYISVKPTSSYIPMLHTRAAVVAYVLVFLTLSEGGIVLVKLWLIFSWGSSSTGFTLSLLLPVSFT